MPDENFVLPDNPNEDIAYLPERLDDIVLAAGNFWSAQALFSRVRGVARCQAGYANGRSRTTTFQEVEQGDTGFAFAIRLHYDPEMVRLEQLLDLFFLVIDPVAKHHQAYDWGQQYRTGIYYTDENDLNIVKKAFARCRAQHEQRLTVELRALQNFVAAEREQQHYLEQHPDTYVSLDFSHLSKFNEERLKEQERSRRASGSSEYEI